MPYRPPKAEPKPKLSRGHDINRVLKTKGPKRYSRLRKAAFSGQNHGTRLK